jgi:hypothetical protein
MQMKSYNENLHLSSALIPSQVNPGIPSPTQIITNIPTFGISAYFNRVRSLNV